MPLYNLHHTGTYGQLIDGCKLRSSDVHRAAYNWMFGGQLIPIARAKETEKSVYFFKEGYKEMVRATCVKTVIYEVKSFDFNS